jgi:hypothetical protein
MDEIYPAHSLTFKSNAENTLQQLMLTATKKSRGTLDQHSNRMGQRRYRICNLLPACLSSWETTAFDFLRL